MDHVVSCIRLNSEPLMEEISMRDCVVCVGIFVFIKASDLSALVAESA